jgi:branched-chain amino acid transport system substrate-binding protein
VSSGEAAALGGDTTPGEAGTAAAACTGQEKPIVIATVGQQTGLVGSLITTGTIAVKAWAARTNAEGGLHCHQVKYLIADDGGDPSRHQALVRQMVEQEGAIAFVYMDNPLTGQASVDYLTQHRIPVIGDSTSEDWFYDSPVYFPQSSTGTQMVIAGFALAGQVAAARNEINLASVACLEVPGCALPQQLAPEQSKRFGMNLVYKAEASLAQPDYTAMCQNAQQAGAQLFFSWFDGGSSRRIARSCNSIGYHPVYFTTGNAATVDMGQDPLMEGMYVGFPVRPWMDTASPAIADYQATLAKYAPGVPPDPSTVIGWTAAKLFEVGAANISANPTSEEILQGLWTVHDNDLGGLTYPLTFTEGQNAPKVVCYYQVQVHDRGYITPNGGERTCI